MRKRSPLLSPTLRQSVPWSWAATGALLGALLTTVAYAPAQWAAQGIAHFSGERVLLRNPQGTVWNGSAQLLLAAGEGSDTRTLLPGRIQWQLRSGIRELGLALRADCCLREAWVWSVRPSTIGVQLNSSELPDTQPLLWPTAMLAGLGTPWNTLKLDGNLALSARNLSLRWESGRWTMDGRVQLDATQMSTSLSTLKPVGSYRVTVIGGPTPTLDLSTLDGSLQLNGSGRWVAGRLQFDGQASAAPERAQALANFLNIIGRREGDRSIIKVG
jgi:general secretion pathway protein N